MNRNIFIFGLMYIFLNCIYCQENTAPYCQNYPDADALGKLNVLLYSL